MFSLGYAIASQRSFVTLYRTPITNMLNAFRPKRRPPPDWLRAASPTVYISVIKLCDFSVSKIVSSEFIECSQFGYLGIRDVLYSYLSSFSFGAVNSFVVTATSSYSLWFTS